ncbi:CLUMA_CG002236, isoform A [Clunio marinus]|uniref:CLUMA_CG002236, isoform A n=1 Tax=Clunio marinus TaxID=568069 RepID=A0A1J1HKE3_9DIPT|nr:CLUMA_CG002236, isoform A [Clunio marinus]
MIIEIFELLQSKTAKNASNVVINFACHEDENKWNIAILQFFIHVLDKNMEITEEVFKNDNQFEKMSLDVYKSLPYNIESFPVETTKTFMTLFMKKALDKNLLTTPVIGNWTRFLEAIIQNKNIPNCIFKGKAIQLLSLLLIPLCNLFKSFEENDELDELKTVVKNSIDRSLTMILKGLRIKIYCVSIAKEIIEAFECYPEIVVLGTKNYLFIYKKMLKQENHLLITLTLKSLTTLCSIESIRQQLDEFFFNHSEDEDLSELMFIINNELIFRKTMKQEVIALLKSMKNVFGDRDFITEQIKSELYQGVFSPLKKVVTETVRIINDWEDNFWSTIVNLLQFHTDRSINLLNFIKMLSSIEEFDSNPEYLIKNILRNNNTGSTLQWNASLLMAMVKSRNENKIILQSIDQIVEMSLKQEETFILILECFSNIKTEERSSFYVENSTKLTFMIHCMITALEKFEKISTLYKIRHILELLSELSPEYVLKEVRIIFNTNYLKGLQFFNECENEECIEKIGKLFTKMFILMEKSNSWNIMKVNSIRDIDKLGCLFLSRSNRATRHIAIRFYTNVLKHVWTRVVLKKSLPWNSSTISEKTKSYIETIPQIWSGGQTVEEISLPLCCTLELLLMFQPSMQAFSDSDVFTKLDIHLNKEQVKKLAAAVENVVFSVEPASKNSQTIFYQQLVLQTWIGFIQNYNDLPSKTSSDKIIRYYNLKSVFIVELELLMKHLVTLSKNIFEQTVASAVLQIAQSKDKFSFSGFYQALDEFLSTSFKSVLKRMSITSSICSFILTNLDGHVASQNKVEEQNRLYVLDFVAIMVKNLDLNLKRKLEDFIPGDFLNRNDLTRNEIKHFNDFLNLLRT